MQSWLDWFTHSPALLLALIALAATCGALIVWAPLRWRRRFRAQAARVADVQGLITEHYERRPNHLHGREIYALAPKLALGEEESSRPRRLAGRASRVAALDTREIERLIAWAKLWIATVGKLASEARARHLPLRIFFRQMHISVITEAAFFWPVLAYGWRMGRWSREEQQHLLWGLTLLEVAVRYNRLSPVQRKAVYMNALANGQTLTIGPLVEAEPQRLHPWHDLLFRLSGFRLRTLGKAGFRQTEDLMEQVVQLIDVPAPRRVEPITRPSATARVFISHAANHPGEDGDDEAAARLVEVLESHAIPCWVAPRDSRGHMDYDREITAAIDDSVAVILLFSATADKRQAVKKELLMAADRGLPILVVRLEPARPIELEYATKTATWRDWFHSEEGQLELLISDLRDVLRLQRY